MDNIANSLRTLAADMVDHNGETMKRWDQIRDQCNRRKGSDLPRLNFEGLMEDISEKLVEGASAIEALETRSRDIQSSLVTALDTSLSLLECVVGIPADRITNMRQTLSEARACFSAPVQ